MTVNLTDVELDVWQEHLAGKTDAQALVDAFTLHRACQDRAGGQLERLLAYNAAAWFHVLARIAPDTLADALAILGEETAPA